MDLKKTNYFDPRKMAARKRWTVQETGQGLIAMTGYAYLGDEEKTALFSGADLEARIRQASAEKPRETELYLRLTDRAGEIYSDEYKAHIDDAEPSSFYIAMEHIEWVVLAGACLIFYAMALGEICSS